MMPDGGVWLDFGRAWFGTLVFPQAKGKVTAWLGEKLVAGRVDRSPPGTIRCRQVEQDLAAAGPRLIIPPDQRNTGPGAILMPKEIGEVTPFRYAEIEASEHFDPASVQMAAVHYPFNDNAADFACSIPALNEVWELCKHTIKATTFCGVYVDGDRERIPYEGDAYINQLGHYCLDAEYAFARHSHEYLLNYPTWPTDWQLYSVLMAWEDFCYTGEKASIRQYTDLLKRKTLIALSRSDGLISTESPAVDRKFEESLNLWNPRYIFEHGLRDLVDWPPGSFTQGGTGERDNHDMRPVNTVVNTLHAAACRAMSSMCAAIGEKTGMSVFTHQEMQVRQAINEKLWDANRGVYIDGEGSDHASLHSNMFMLAFNLVPKDRLASVTQFVLSRGMACSVYGAQFLLEALFRAGQGDAAIELMTAEHDRGWRHMIKSGSTMTWEAWDWKYKNNLDWNHAWGTAPANIIPRWLMGIRPKNGFRQVMIQPCLGSMRHARLKHPTPFGPIEIRVSNPPRHPLEVQIELPAGVEATVALPGETKSGKPAIFTRLTGKHELVAY